MIGAGRRKENIRREDLTALGEAVGLQARGVSRALDELLERIDLWLTDLDALPFEYIDATSMNGRYSDGLTPTGVGPLYSQPY